MFVDSSMSNIDMLWNSEGDDMMKTFGGFTLDSQVDGNDNENERFVEIRLLYAPGVLQAAIITKDKSLA